jgi:hypothetical protein
MSWRRARPLILTFWAITLGADLAYHLHLAHHSWWWAIFAGGNVAVALFLVMQDARDLP